ncbi:alpha-glucuronidase family glycosyl hydrolase [Bacillus sp. N9]
MEQSSDGLVCGGGIKRLFEEAGYESVVCDRSQFSDTCKKIILIGIEEYHSEFPSHDRLEIQDDGFALVEKGEDLWIIGNEPRSILYGVYTYCSKTLGYQWFDLNQEKMVKAETFEGTYIHQPYFARRGNIIETINDPAYIQSLIDWGVKTD